MIKSLALVPVVLIALTGCSGFTATKSVSPLDFFLPGGGSFLQNSIVPTQPKAPQPVATACDLACAQ